MKRKVLILTAAVIVGICMIIPIMAKKAEVDSPKKYYENRHEEIEKSLKNPILSESVKELTFEEAAHKRAEREGISYERAVQVMKDEEKALENFELQKKSNGTGSIYSYYDYSVHATYPGNSKFSAAYGVTLRLAADHGSKNIVGTSGSVWSKAVSGTNNYSWKPMSQFADVSYDKRYVTIGVTGYFETSMATNVGGTVSIPGFSVSSSSGGTTYFVSSPFSPRSTYYAN